MELESVLRLNKDHVVPVESSQANTALWVVAHLRDSKPEMAVGILHAWTHSKRTCKVTEQLVHKIKNLNTIGDRGVVTEMAGPKQFI